MQYRSNGRQRYLAFIAMGTVLVGFVAALLISNYFSQIELQTVALEQLKSDTEKQATAVSYFFLERKNDLRNLAEKRELSIFFENKALEMSMEYGLRDSLLGIAKIFERFMVDRKLGVDGIYNRIALVESSGEVLVDRSRKASPGLQEPELRRFLEPGHREPKVIVDQEGSQQEIVISLAYFFKERYAGQIVAWISSKTMFNHLVKGTGRASQRFTNIIGPSGQPIYLPEKPPGEFSFPGLPPFADTAPEEVLQYLSVRKDGARAEMIATRTPVKDTPFFLVTVSPASEVFGHTSPRHLLVVMVLISLAILGGMAVVVRLDLRKKRELEREIKERRLAEEALRKSEAEYRELYEGMQDGSTVVNMEGRIIEFNSAFQQMLGYPSEEIYRLTYEDITPSEWRPLEEKIITEQVFVRGYSDSYEKEYRRQDGTVFPVELRTYLMRDDLGNPTGMWAFIRDITERKRAEEALRERMKEQTCAAAVSRDMQEDFCIDELCRRAVDHLVQAMRFPEISVPVIELNGKRFTSENYTEGLSHGLHAEIRMKDEAPLGHLRVYYAEERPFLIPEEQNLINIVAASIGTWLERKRAEEALRETRNYLEKLVNYANAPIIVWDPESKITRFNQAFENLTGFSANEVIGQKLDLLCSEKTCQESLRNLACGEHWDSVEIPIRHKSGDIRIVLWSSANIYAEDGATLVATIAQGQDITERKKAEDNLLREKNFSDMAIESLPGLFYLFDDQGNFLRWNSNFEQVSGYSAEELAGMKPQDFFMSLEKQRIQDAVLEVFQKGFVVVEADFVSKDGRLSPYFFTGRRCMVGDRQCLLGMGIDITGRKEAEKAFRSLVFNAPIGIYIVMEGKFAMVNPGFEAISGYTAKELEGQDSLLLISPQDKRLLREKFIQKAKGFEVPPYEFQFTKKSGETGWGLGTFALTHYEGHEAVLGYFMDITSHKKLEEQFIQAQKMEAVGRLAGGVAHDFNNILTAIMGCAELAKLALDEDDPAQPYIEETISAAQLAASLTRQLLAFSRRQILQPKVINLNSVVTDLEKMLRRLIAEDILFTFVLDPELRMTKADPGQIEQILLNLVINARDSMPLGGNLIVETGNFHLDNSMSLKIPGSLPGNYVMLMVSDTGMGMDAETLSHIFEPFFTTKESGKGTGMGLSTVFGIVKQSGGSIEVSSKPGMGTSFKIYLPQFEGAEQPREKVTSIMISQGSETILVVEDDEALRSVVTKFLKKYGYSVLEAKEGSEAMVICERYEGPIHLMLTDIVMPHLSGLELGRLVAQFYPEMKVIYMSGYSEAAIIDPEVLDSLVFLQKPFTPIDLVHKIRAVLDGSPRMTIRQ